MTDAPERLRTRHYANGIIGATDAGKPCPFQGGNHIAEAAYIRLDLHEAEVARLRAVAIQTAASLAAAISLLERGGKKAAASDKMFAQMLTDYRNALNEARKALRASPEAIAIASDPIA